MSDRPQLESKIYDSLAAFNATACWDVLRLAQMRQYLAEHLAGDLLAAVLPAPADRPAVLLWAAAAIDATFTGPGSDRYVRYGADLLRRLADEAQQPEAEAKPVEAAPVCESFQWIGQSFATCERCGQPAWDHVGEDVPAEGAGPFGTERTVRLWKPGEADAIRAKWAPAEGAQR